MQTLVEHETVKIKVRDTAGICVCRRCRGAKTEPVILYYNSGAIWRGGLLSIWGQKECNMCDGAGYWKTPNDLSHRDAQGSSRGSGGLTGSAAGGNGERK